MKKHLLTISLILLTGLTPLFAQSDAILLSDLDITKAYQPYGLPMVNRAVTGEPFQVSNQSYKTGFGVLSDGHIKINLQKKSTQFTCQVGVNDQTLDYNANDISMIPLTDGTMIFYQQSNDEKQFVGIGAGDRKINKGSVIFRILGDGKELYNSGVMAAGDKAKQVDLSVVNVAVLELVTEPTADGNSGDHANWLDAKIAFEGTQPQLVDAEFKGAVKAMDPAIAKHLSKKMNALPEISLPLALPAEDWLIAPSNEKAKVYQAHGGKDIVFSNGLVSRMFRITPNLATVDFINQMTGESMLRAVSNEGVLVLDGKQYTIGGLSTQKEYAYTQYEWLDDLTATPNSFRVTDFTITEVVPRINWAQTRWSLVKDWKPKGKTLTFTLEGPDHLKDIKVLVHYVLYDGIPTISKWIEVKNQSSVGVLLDEFTLEQLAMVEPESPVETKIKSEFLKPNIHIESDWAFLGFTEREAEQTEQWNVDPRYTSQCNYPLLTPCLLEVKPPMGPNEFIHAGSTFTTFRTWIMPFDSEDRERKGLFIKRMYRIISPWVTENPIFMHCTSSDPKVVKEAIDQCKETGYEMVILSFGSGLNMEDESPANIAKFKALKAYAVSKGIELGGYSLLSSRWISDDVDVINPKTGKRGGMIFGSSPCLSSDWGKDYFRKIKSFFEQTGMTVFENDGSYPGNVCASTTHAHHKGLEDSQWKQRKEMATLYKWMCENGIYTNVPDAGYLLNGSTKVGIGYREVNWSLPRERQLVLGRQVMYDGLWERLPGMCWTFVPLVQYHGGGKDATLEPLNDHIVDYKAHMMQNYGAGVQACYRGHRLYDTPATKAAVIEVITWYKKYREILNSELLHLRRADGKDYDGVMHVNPRLKEKAMALLYNPTDKEIVRKIKLPLYYTGLKNKAKISILGKSPKTYKLDRAYNATITVTIPARGNTWLIVE